MWPYGGGRALSGYCDSGVGGVQNEEQSEGRSLGLAKLLDHAQIVNSENPAHDAVRKARAGEANVLLKGHLLLVAELSEYVKWIVPIILYLGEDQS